MHGSGSEMEHTFGRNSFILRSHTRLLCQTEHYFQRSGRERHQLAFDAEANPTPFSNGVADFTLPHNNTAALQLS
jgi:hypothetical protein